MKRIGCIECGSGITLLRGINCSVTKVEREHGEWAITVRCKINAYCAKCGTLGKYLVQHSFSRDFDNIPTEYLVTIALYDQGG